MVEPNEIPERQGEDPYVGPPTPELPSLPSSTAADGIGGIHSFIGFLRSTHTAASKLSVKSALNPVLWACGISTPMCFLAAYFFDDNIQIYLVIVGSLPIIALVLGFVGFAVLDPKRLQSEDYQIRQQTLNLIEQRGGHINVDTISLDAIANPKVGDNG